MTRPPVRGDDAWADPDPDGTDAEWVGEDDDWADEPDDDAGCRGRGGRVRGARRRPAAARPAGRRSSAGRGRAALRACSWPARPGTSAAGSTRRARRASRGRLHGAERLVGQRRGHLLEDEGVIVDAQVFRWLPALQGRRRVPGRRLRLPARTWRPGTSLDVLRAEPLPVESVALHRARGPDLAEVPAAIVDDIPGFDVAALAGAASPAARSARPRSIPPRPPPSRASSSPTPTWSSRARDEQAALTRMAAQFDAVAAEIGLRRAGCRASASPRTRS